MICTRLLVKRYVIHSRLPTTAMVMGMYTSVKASRRLISSSAFEAEPS